MLKTPLDQWRPKFEEVGQIFGKEKETKKNGSNSMMKSKQIT